MSKPERIVSLVPSTTETLFSLGAAGSVVGVTRFCVHPEDARDRARVVGGTKNPRIEAVFALEPDLVLANQEENRKEDVERLRERIPVQVFFPKNVSEAVADIRLLGNLLGESKRALALVEELEGMLATLRAPRGDRRRLIPYLYFIWRRPYMVAGPETFIESFLAEAGFANAAPRDRGRYPEMGIEEISRSGAEALLLSSEPFPFDAKHGAELSAHLATDASVYLVDGELLSWHGARLRLGLPYLRDLAERISTSKAPSARPSPGPFP
jgi:ABC-type Fe3+-hydroxamate transport system substrate-binding protein